MSPSPRVFCIYIGKLEECLEITRCKGNKLAGIILTLLFYTDDIVILAISHDDLDKELTTLYDYCSKMGMTVNTNKTKIMITKSKMITHGNFLYYRKSLEHVSSYKSLGTYIPYQLNWN